MSRTSRAAIAAVAAVAAFAALMSSGALCHADPGRPTASDAMFRQARELMARGQYDQACPLLEQSERLDPGVGTEFNLARCYELSGRLASAWRMYEAVVRATHASGQTARESIARDRAATLAPRLAHLVVRSAGEVDLAITVDDRPLGKVAEADLAVDTGPHRIVATTPGKRAFSQRLVVEHDGDAAVVQVPVLAPVAPEAPVVASSPTRPLPSLDKPEESHRTRRTVALAFAGASLVAAGLGTYFAVRANAERDDASGHCGALGCDAQGFSSRTDSLAAGDHATLTFGLAGALAACAGVLLLTSTASSAHDTRRESSVSFGVTAAGLAARGAF